MGLAQWLENKNAAVRDQLREDGRVKGAEKADTAWRNWYNHEKANGRRFENPPSKGDVLDDVRRK